MRFKATAREVAVRIYLLILVVAAGMGLASCGKDPSEATQDNNGEVSTPGMRPGCFDDTGTRHDAGARWCRAGQIHECRSNGEWTNLGTKC